MVRGQRKHLKRLNAPKSWMLDKLGGKWAPRPSTGPHKLRESLPLAVLLRNRLKYALTRNEVFSIVKQRLIHVDKKVRTDINFPAGIMDVISIDKTGEHFRLLYDIKGRFAVHRITPEEANFKLCKVKRQQLGPKGIPFIVTHDGRTIRYPHPDIRVDDTVMLDLSSGKVKDFVQFAQGNVAMVTGGHNIGRVGTIVLRERHAGSYEIVHMKDEKNQEWATRASNVLIIGKGTQPWISLPRSNGIRTPVHEEWLAKYGEQVAATQAAN